MNNGANSIIIKRTLKNDFYSTLKPLILNIIQSIIIQSLTSYWLINYSSVISWIKDFMMNKEKRHKE